MEITPVVNEEEVPVTQEPDTPEEVTPEVPKPGEKTDSALLLDSLQKEREKRRELEAELEVLKQTPPDNNGEVFSDEGKVLMREISSLKETLASRDEREQLTALQSQLPPLKDKEEEFNQFRALPENKGMKLETAAKAFLIENELYEVPKPRKGLEKPAGGGGRTPPKSDTMTPEEVDELRTNNYRKYSSMVRKGEIKI